MCHAGSGHSQHDQLGACGWQNHRERKGKDVEANGKFKATRELAQI
jgi:hypothetical protein